MFIKQISKAGSRLAYTKRSKRVQEVATVQGLEQAFWMADVLVTCGQVEEFTGAHTVIYTEPTTKQFLTTANYISIKLDIHTHQGNLYVYSYYLVWHRISYRNSCSIPKSKAT